MAIENLARECLEYQTFQTLRWLPQNTADDENVRRTVVRLLPNWGDGPTQLNALISALSIPGVRSEAVKALDSMAPVRDQRDARLVDNLTRLRAGGWNFLQVAALPQIYGRDPRVLDFLKEWMQTGNQWQRALAASELCGLGETEAAFGAASDPNARVRRSLAVAIGYFNEGSGAEILSRMLNDNDPTVSRAAQISLEMIRNPGIKISRYSEAYASSEWAALLKELSELRLTDPQLLARLSGGGISISRSWLWETGATESQITALEQRIGRSLPLLFDRIEWFPGTRHFHTATLQHRSGRLVSGQTRGLGSGLSRHLSAPQFMPAGERDRGWRSGLAEPKGGVEGRRVADLFLCQLDSGRKSARQLRRIHA